MKKTEEELQEDILNAQARSVGTVVGMMRKAMDAAGDDTEKRLAAVSLASSLVVQAVFGVDGKEQGADNGWSIRPYTCPFCGRPAKVYCKNEHTVLRCTWSDCKNGGSAPSIEKFRAMLAEIEKEDAERRAKVMRGELEGQ